MATTLTLNSLVSVYGTYSSDAAPSALAQEIFARHLASYSNGTGSGQANTPWYRQVAVTTSPTSYDFTSGMVDEFGTALTFAKLNEFLVVCLSITGSDYVRVGGNFLSSISPFTTGDYIVVYGGGSQHWRSPITGVTIVNATNDALTLTGSTSLNVELLLIGQR